MFLQDGGNIAGAARKWKLSESSIRKIAQDAGIEFVRVAKPRRKSK